MSSNRRRAEASRVQEEGVTAFINGRHRQENPYPTASPNWLQWLSGYERVEHAAAIEPVKDW